MARETRPTGTGSGFSLALATGYWLLTTGYWLLTSISPFLAPKYTRPPASENWQFSFYFDIIYDWLRPMAVLYTFIHCGNGEQW
jgi:hypothetical protein